MSAEPSKWAVEAEAKLRVKYVRGALHSEQQQQMDWYWKDGSLKQKHALRCIQSAIEDACAEKDAEIERLKGYQKKHSGDCTFYSALVNGRCWDGICTCGYGLDLWRMGVLDQMLSAERADAEADKLKR